MLDEAYQEAVDRLENVRNTSLTQLENVRREIGIYMLLRGAPLCNPTPCNSTLVRDKDVAAQHI